MSWKLGDEAEKELLRELMRRRNENIRKVAKRIKEQQPDTPEEEIEEELRRWM